MAFNYLIIKLISLFFETMFRLKNLKTFYHNTSFQYVPIVTENIVSQEVIRFWKSAKNGENIKYLKNSYKIVLNPGKNVQLLENKFIDQIKITNVTPLKISQV